MAGVLASEPRKSRRGDWFWRIRYHSQIGNPCFYKYVNSGGTFGANPLRQTIGLGTAPSIDLLEVSWPTTGGTQTFRDVPMDRILEITEGEEQYETLELETLTLQSSAR